MIKNIVDCTPNSIQIIKKIHTTGALRQRLISFGFMKGVEIENIGHTNLKGTYEIQVGKATIALRKEEAQTIEVV